MIAALILVISLAALLQFFVSYCRSLISASRRVALSDQAREVAGVTSMVPGGEQFRRLIELLRLCPDIEGDRREIRLVGTYFFLLNLVRSISRSLAPGVANWAETERSGCAWFAAVALDRRIAFSRELLAQQSANRL